MRRGFRIVALVVPSQHHSHATKGGDKKAVDEDSTIINGILVPQGVDVEEGKSVFRPLTVALVGHIMSKFGGQIQEMIDRRVADRAKAMARVKEGKAPYELSDETAYIRDGQWVVTLPNDPLVTNPGIEVTGPAFTVADGPKMAIKLAGARPDNVETVMIDLEDSFGFGGKSRREARNFVSGLSTMKLLWDGTLSYAASNGKKYTVPEIKDYPHVIFRIPGLFIRAHGFELPGLTTGLCVRWGSTLPAWVISMATYLENNVSKIIDNKRTPHLYLPKLHSAKDAQLVNHVLSVIESKLGLTDGSVKVSLLVEHPQLLVEIEEAMYAFQSRLVGVNCARWDYLAQYQQIFSENANAVFPDFAKVTVKVPPFNKFQHRVINACYKRGVLPLGGMEALFDPSNASAMSRVVAAKKEEFEKMGFQRTWLAHPGAAPAVYKAIQPFFTKYDEAQKKFGKELKPVEELFIISPEILAPENYTTAGIREDLEVCLKFISALLGGTASVAIKASNGDLKMEDIAVAEGRFARLVGLYRHEKTVEGKTVTKAYFNQLLEEAFAKVDSADSEVAYARRFLVHAREVIRTGIANIDFRQQFSLFHIIDKLKEGNPAAPVPKGKDLADRIRLPKHRPTTNEIAEISGSAWVGLSGVQLAVQRGRNLRNLLKNEDKAITYLGVMSIATVSVVEGGSRDVTNGDVPESITKLLNKYADGNATAAEVEEAFFGINSAMFKDIIPMVGPYCGGWQTNAMDNVYKDNNPDTLHVEVIDIENNLKQIRNFLVKADKVQRQRESTELNRILKEWARFRQGGSTEHEIQKSCLEKLASMRQRHTNYLAAPVLVDVENGWNDTNRIAKAIRFALENGANNMHVESQKIKRCGHLGGKSVLTTEQFGEILSAMSLSARQVVREALIAEGKEVTDQAVREYTHNLTFTIRTDALHADFIGREIAREQVTRTDHAFVDFSGPTPDEKFWRLITDETNESTGRKMGMDYSIRQVFNGMVRVILEGFDSRGWMETADPTLAEYKEFIEGLNELFVDYKAYIRQNPEYERALREQKYDVDNLLSRNGLRGHYNQSPSFDAPMQFRRGAKDITADIIRHFSNTPLSDDKNQGIQQVRAFLNEHGDHLQADHQFSTETLRRIYAFLHSHLCRNADEPRADALNEIMKKLDTESRYAESEMIQKLLKKNVHSEIELIQREIGHARMEFYSRQLLRECQTDSQLVTLPTFHVLAGRMSSIAHMAVDNGFASYVVQAQYPEQVYKREVCQRYTALDHQTATGTRVEGRFGELVNPEKADDPMKKSTEELDKALKHHGATSVHIKTVGK